MGASRKAGQGGIKRSSAGRDAPPDPALPVFDRRFAGSDALLHTSSGSLAFLDESSRRLRHGPPGAVPHNLVLRAKGSFCRLLAAPGAGGPLLNCILPPWDAGPCRLEPLDHGFRLVRHDPEPGSIALRDGEAALRAEPNGRLTLLPADGSPSEHFRPVLRRTLEIRDILLKGRWLDADRGSFVQLAGGGGTLAVESAPIPLSGIPGPFVPEPQSGPILRLHIAGPGGRLIRLARYRPLVCFALFGAERYYECLTLALQSLAEHGKYEGDICIASDRPRSWVAGCVPDAFRKRWIHMPSDPGARLFGRYDMTGWGIEAFQPILYLDADIVANAPLGTLLQRLALSPSIHLATENRLLPALAGSPAPAYAATTTGDWFGTWLCDGDPRFASRRFSLGSSGILGFANIDTVRTAFGVIRALRRTADAARIAAFTDQALANYALHLLGNADFELIDRWLHYYRGYDPVPPERLGLVHFHSGVGNAEGKHGAMAAYLAHLGEEGCDE